MSIKSKIKRLLNRIIKRGYWYNNILFPDCKKFWEYRTFNTKVVNLGSTSALNAFCYDGIPIKAANWAMGHNPLLGDQAILKNYSSFLDPNKCVVILPLCPFSSLAGSYDYFDDRYYTTLYCTTISGYSFQRELQVSSLKDNPFPHYPIAAILKDIKMSFFSKKQSQLSESQMEQDAQNWMDNWMKEFSISNFSYPLSLINQDAIKDAAKIMNEIIAFCKSHNISPAILIPPMYHTLGEKFTPEIRMVIIDSLLDNINDKSVWFHNYMDDIQYSNDITLFQNSFLMNKKGAMLFTHRVLTDIGLFNN